MLGFPHHNVCVCSVTEHGLYLHGWSGLTLGIQEDLQNIFTLLQGEVIIFLLAAAVLCIPLNSRHCPLALRGEAASYSNYVLLFEKHPVQQNPNSD